MIVERKTMRDTAFSLLSKLTHFSVPEVASIDLQQEVSFVDDGDAASSPEEKPLAD
jgi:hypothetical protein